MLILAVVIVGKMLNISISISVCRQGRCAAEDDDLMRHEPVSSYSVSTPYLSRSSTNSLEGLLAPTKRRFRLVDFRERNRSSRRIMMAGQDGVQIVERKMSYGIGGAGNIREFSCLEGFGGLEWC